MKSFKKFRNDIVRTAHVALWPSEYPSSIDSHFFESAEDFLSSTGSNYRILLSEFSDNLGFDERVNITRNMHPKFARSISDAYSVEDLPEIIESIENTHGKLVILVPQGFMESTKDMICSMETPLTCEIIESRFDYSGAPINQAIESKNFKQFVDCLPEAFSSSADYFNSVVSSEEPVQSDNGDIFREMYIRGEIFNIGESVVSENGEVLKVTARRPNFVVCEDSKGKESKQWITKLIPVSFSEDYLPSEFNPIIEEITQEQLSDIKRFADRLLAKLDKPTRFKFDQHFADRSNDSRNRDPITVAELMHFIRKMAKKHVKGGDFYPNRENEIVLKDMTTDINIPFIIKHLNGEWVMVAKSIMRKPNYTSTNKIIKMESVILDLDEAKDKKGKKKDDVSKPRYHIDWNTGSRTHRVKKGKGSYSRKGKKDYKDE